MASHFDRRDQILNRLEALEAELMAPRSPNLQVGRTEAVARELETTAALWTIAGELQRGADELESTRAQMRSSSDEITNAIDAHRGAMGEQLDHLSDTHAAAGRNLATELRDMLYPMLGSLRDELRRATGELADPFASLLADGLPDLGNQIASTIGQALGCAQRELCAVINAAQLNLRDGIALEIRDVAGQLQTAEKANAVELVRVLEFAAEKLEAIASTLPAAGRGA